MYTGLYQVLHVPGCVEYDIKTLKRGTSLSEYKKGNMTFKKGNMALMKGNMALTKGNMAVRCAMLERAR